MDKEFDIYDLLKYASTVKQQISDLTKNNDSNAVSYSSFTKDDVLTYLKNPSNVSNEQRLRKASIQMFSGNNQYWRLIMHYSMMPMWVYSISPRTFDPDSGGSDKFRVQFYKSAGYIEKINLRHEMRKAMPTIFSEGVLYGAIWSNNETWFIQKIDPDICKISSIADGTCMYAVDMSKIKEENLGMYPPEFKTMWDEYRSTGQKWQEVPEKISFCVKANENLSYTVPPFAGVLPAIYDLENYKELAKVATELSNYKLLSMQVPTDNKGKLTMEWDRIMEFYEHLSNALPPYVGAAAIPMRLDSVNFERSGIARDTDEIESATRHFWYSSGTSPLLFGDASNTSSSALSLSIKASEGIVFSIMSQCERLINRHLKFLSGKPKFKVVIHPVTIFNYEQWVKYFKDAGTLGLPVKMAYNAIMGIESADVSAMAYLENDVLGLASKFQPLSSSYMQSADEAGRPVKPDDEIGDEGERTRDKGSNENR